MNTLSPPALVNNFTALARALLPPSGTLEQPIERTAYHVLTAVSTLPHYEQTSLWSNRILVDISRKELVKIIEGLASQPSLAAGLLAYDPQLATQLSREISLVTPGYSAEVPQYRLECEAIRTGLMIARSKLDEMAESYGETYPGIPRYLKAIRSRLRTLGRIQKTLEKGCELKPGLKNHWWRLKIAYLGQKETGYQSRIERHLELLKTVSKQREGTPADGDPLLTEMLSRRKNYLQILTHIARDGLEPWANLKIERECSYHEAMEARYFLKGLFPSRWVDLARHELQTANRNPNSWMAPVFLGVVTTLLKTTGVAPSSWDGVIFSPVRKTYDGNALTIEPLHQPPATGYSKSILYQSLLDTMSSQLALVHTADNDQTGYNFDVIINAWMGTVLALSGTTVRIEGLENLNGLHDQNLIIAPTHRGFSEYPIVIGIGDEFGHSLRIVAKDGFRTNPVIRALVGEALKRHDFPFIDRSAGSSAARTMMATGIKMKGGNKSIATFPSGSRSPVLMMEGGRVEGPHYQAKGGIAFMAQAAGDPLIVPVAISGAGRVTPKSLSEQARGVLTGTTIVVKIGAPFRASEVSSTGMTTEQIQRAVALQMDPHSPQKMPEVLEKNARAVAARLDRIFEQLTGLPTGPLYHTKGPKTIFQAHDERQLERELQQRLQNPGAYRNSAVVLPPSWTPSREIVEKILRKYPLPPGKKLIVFQTIEDTSKPGGYRFDSYEITG